MAARARAQAIINRVSSREWVARASPSARLADDTAAIVPGTVETGPAGQIRAAWTVDGVPHEASWQGHTKYLSTHLHVAIARIVRAAAITACGGVAGFVAQLGEQSPDFWKLAQFSLGLVARCFGMNPKPI